MKLHDGHIIERLREKEKKEFKKDLTVMMISGLLFIIPLVIGGLIRV